MPQSCLYIGTVYHKRHQPFIHKFHYRVFTMLVDIDDLEKFSKKLRFFSFNRWNILGLRNKDHGNRDGSNLRPWIENAADDKDIDIKGGKIFMLTFPRLWGFVFNPLSIYFLYDKNKNLKAILHQVKNTFGGQHCYLLEPQKLSEKSNHIKQSAQKIFHVSPFIQMDCHYDFILQEPEEELDIAIHQFQPNGKILTATWDGKRYDLTDKNILKAVLRHPLMTLKIIVGIHWEALWILGKGAKYISNPGDPDKQIS